MIIVVNEELFKTKEIENVTVGNKQFKYKTNYSISDKVIKRQKDKETGKFIERPYTRSVLDVYYDDLEYHELGLSMTFVQNRGGKGESQLPLKCFADGEAQFDSELFLIAIPFNGTLDIIPKSYDYRILGGTIVKSQYKNIQIEGDSTKYNKILYLAVSPDSRKLYDADHSYHKDSIDVNITWYNVEPNQGQRDSDSVKHTTTISIYVDKELENLTYNIKNSAVYGEPINTDNLVKSRVFEIYKPKKKIKNRSL